MDGESMCYVFAGKTIQFVTSAGEGHPGTKRLSLMEMTKLKMGSKTLL
jgi:hypothetical protein